MAYLNQYQRLFEKAEAGELNSAELMLLNKFHLGEMSQFEHVREWSRDLLTNWLSSYKFKNWNTHSSNNTRVTDDEKRERAKEIAAVLGDNERWHSHGRMISRDTLVSYPIRLKIEKLEEIPALFPDFDEYVSLLKDYVQREQFPSFIHTREYF